MYGAPRNEETVIGINSKELDDIILNINNEIDRISESLNQIQMKFYDTKEYFKGDVAESIRNKYDFYNSQKETVIDNLKTYSNDLIKMKTMVDKIDAKSSSLLDDFKDSVNKKTQETIEKNGEYTTDS